MNSIFISLLLLSSIVQNEGASTSNVVVTMEVDHIRSQKGQLYIFVYNYENQYPDNPYRHLTFPKTGLVDKKLIFEMTDLPEGEYGLVIMDDENANNDLDRWLGIPKEGFCFSNMAKPRRLRFPKFKDILVKISPDSAPLNFRMQYIL